MDVGVRELKARLSEFLDRAARGEVIRVTERGRPKAILGPISGELRLQQGIAEGWIRPGKPGVRPRVRRRFKSKMTVQEMLDEDRGD
jgi:prevent-host-death family protein